MTDVILKANILTMDSAQPRAAALVVREGRIAAVGDEPAVRASSQEHAPAVDLKGLTILPGLADAHLHLEWYALARLAVDAETPTLAESLERVRARAAATPPGTWITGRGWNQNVWDGWPSAARR